MSNITPSPPSFVFGYWRPWKEDSNLFDSYLDYSRDISLVKYGADTVGQYINQASQAQIEAINQLGESIGRGMNALSNQMTDINETLGFINRNMDILVEQQKLSNLLLENIAELLRVPDSEKERQHCIELGIKFFVNASLDADLYADALEELQKAESFMKQDYFVLHRIGCIYLYVDKYINPEKALDYFLRAAKYASVETDNEALHLANVLTNNFYTVNSDINNSEYQIGLLAADSYEKSAFVSYILGRFSDAVRYQSKALKYNEITANRFLLAKYQVRNEEIAEGVRNLRQCIDEDPILAVASFKELDLINEPEIINLISHKNKEIDNRINVLLSKWKTVESIKAAKIIEELTQLSYKSYEIKVTQFKIFENQANEIDNEIRVVESEIDSYVAQMKKITFCTLNSTEIQLLVDELVKAKDLPIEKMIEVFSQIKEKVDADRLKIGAKYAGGIVFYIDDTGNHGLVCAEMDFGLAKWTAYKYSGERMGVKILEIGALGNGIADGSGMQNTRNIVEHASWLPKPTFFSGVQKTAVATAARLCLESNHNGFSDWYLPTKNELQLMYETLKSCLNIGDFQMDCYWSSWEVGSNYLLEEEIIKNPLSKVLFSIGGNRNKNYLGACYVNFKDGCYNFSNTDTGIWGPLRRENKDKKLGEAGRVSHLAYVRAVRAF